MAHYKTSNAVPLPWQASSGNAISWPRKVNVRARPLMAIECACTQALPIASIRAYVQDLGGILLAHSPVTTITQSQNTKIKNIISPHESP